MARESTSTPGLSGLFDRFFPRRLEQRSGDLTRHEKLLESVDAGGGPAIAVSESTALNLSSVFACVGILSDEVAMLPLKLYRRTANGREEAKDHPAHKVISRMPSDLATPFELRRQGMTSACLGGNAYIRVHKSGRGEPGELEWLKPADVNPKKVGRVMTYEVKGERDISTRANMIHVRSVSPDGIKGASFVQVMRSSISTQIQQRTVGDALLRNGARFPGFLKAPQGMTKQQLEDSRREWQSKQEGAINAGKTPILPGGWDYAAANGMTLADAEFLGSRRFEVEEVARGYRIPLFLLSSTEKSTTWGSGLEQIELGFLKHTINPWLVNWEQVLDYTLLTSAEIEAGYYFRFTRGAFAQADLQSQAKFFREMRDIGVFSVNEIRRKLEENDIEGGDDYGAPFNGSGGRPSEPAPSNSKQEENK